MLISLVALYLGLLKWLYAAVIVPAYLYTGLRYSGLDVTSEVLTWVLALAPALWLPTAFERPSRLLLWIQYLVVYLPTTCFPLYNARPGDRPVWPLIIVMLGALLIVQGLTSLPRATIPALNIRPAMYRVLLVILAIIMLAPIVTTFGIPRRLPALAQVYDVRADYKAALSGVNTILVYWITWFGRVLAPMLIIEGVVNRRWGIFGFGMLGTIYVFAVSGMKMAALTGLFLIGLRVLFTPGGRGMAVRLTGSLLLGVFLGCLVDTALGIPAFVGLIVRRVLIIPGLLNGHYYQFFSSHPIALLGASFLRPLAGYPYDAPPPTIIGAVYFGNAQANANVNLWGDAFLNFGLSGVLVYGAVLGVVLWLFDSLAKGRSALVTGLMLGIPAITLTNSALPTTLLTNGLALTFMLAALLPSTGERVRKEPCAA